MDFQLSKMHLLQQELFRKFAETEIRPLAKEMDEKDAYDLDLVAKMQGGGFLGIPYSGQYGGAGADTLAYTLCMEEVSKVDASTGITISVHTSLCCSCINNYGTEEQKQKYVVPWVKGEKRSAFTLTEPGAGSDAAGMQTTAELIDGEFVVNGTKAFITGAREADFFQTYCQFKAPDGTKSPICLLIDVHECEGITIGRNEDLMGMRASSVAEVIFDNVHVPAENLLGQIGKGFHAAMSTLDAGRLGISAVCVGMAQDAVDQTVKYTKERMQFGKRISQFQNTQFKLAEYQTKVEAARLMVYNCASMMDNGQRVSHLSSMAKYYASDVLNEVVRGCLQLHGGYGYSKEFVIEKLYRDAKLTEIFEGTSEIQKKIIAKWMGVK